MISLEYIFLLSSVIRTCQGISATDGDQADSCEAPALENGRHLPNKISFEVGEWLQYRCEDGYMTAQRNIVEDVRCLSSGWSTVPQCSGIVCSFQSKTGSDKVQMVYSDGPVAKFSCKEGFTLQGSAISQCYYYGWDPPLPTCQVSGERTRCPPPPQPMNIHEMKLKSDYLSGDKESLKCKPGFQLYGAQTIICRNGQWTSPPQCVHGCILSKETMLENGVRLQNAPFKISEGESVEFLCIGDRVPSQSLTATCKDGKIHYPRCIVPDSESCRLSVDKITQNNLVLPKSTSLTKVYSNGDSILTRCKANYYRASPTSSVECIDGKMIYPKCMKEKPCRINQENVDENFLELHPDHENKVFFENEEAIHFVCKAGYTSTTVTTGHCIKEDIIYPFCHEI